MSRNFVNFHEIQNQVNSRYDLIFPHIFQGDSGGPLQCNMGDGRWYLAGITSFGSGCAKAGYPDVFARLTHYVDWIQETIVRHSLMFNQNFQLTASLRGKQSSRIHRRQPCSLTFLVTFVATFFFQHPFATSFQIFYLFRTLLPACLFPNCLDLYKLI